MRSPWRRLVLILSLVRYRFFLYAGLLPYLLGAETLLPALVVSMLALFAVGVLVSRVTVRSWFFSGMRQLTLGAVAAGVTYLVGSAVGTGV